MLVMASILFWFDSSLISSVTFQRINDTNKDKFNNNTFTDLLTSPCLPQSILLWQTPYDFICQKQTSKTGRAWKTVPMVKNLKPLHFWSVSLLKQGNNKGRKQITIYYGGFHAMKIQAHLNKTCVHVLWFWSKWWCMKCRKFNK